MEDATDEKTEKSILLSSGNKERIKYRPITVEPALILYTLYFGGSIPLIQQYVYKKIGENKNFETGLNASNSTAFACKDLNKLNPENEEAYEAFLIEQDIQRISSLWLVSFTAMLLAPSLVSSLMLGSYSDMVGRKVALVASILGAATKCAIVALVIWQNLALPYIYIGVALEGISGGALTFYTATFSYIVDITTREQRAFRIIILQFCLALGVVVAEVAIGYFITILGYLWPVLIILVCLAVNLIYVFYFLPNAMPSNANPKEAKLFQLANFKKSFNLYIIDTGAKRRWKLHMCFALTCLLSMCELGRTDVSILFILSSPLCFTSVLIGYFAAAAYLLPGIGSVMITKLCQTRMKETGLIMLGCASAAASCVVFAFSTKIYIVFLTCLVGFFSRLPVGMLRSYTSKIVEPNETGALFASVAWLEGLGTIIGGLMFTAIYNATLSWFRGFVFLVIGVFYCISFIITMTLRRRENYLASRLDADIWPVGISSSGDENEINTHNKER